MSYKQTKICYINVAPYDENSIKVFPMECKKSMHLWDKKLPLCADQINGKNYFTWVTPQFNNNGNR